MGDRGRRQDNLVPPTNEWHVKIENRVTITE